MYCQTCGAKFVADSPFCPSCGTPAPRSTQSVLKTPLPPGRLVNCIECGAILTSKHSKKCDTCGTLQSEVIRTKKKSPRIDLPTTTPQSAAVIVFLVAIVLLPVVWLYVTSTNREQSQSVTSIQYIETTNTISRTDFGDEWPFSVDSGTLACEGNAVTFVADGVTYAINGTALTRSIGMDIRESAIWVDDPSGSGKKSIGDIITRGLALCP